MLQLRTKQALMQQTDYEPDVEKAVPQENHLTPTAKIPILIRLGLGDVWALELLLRDVISFGGDLDSTG